MNKEFANNVREVMLLATQSSDGKVTPNSIVDSLKCSLKDAFNYVEQVEHLNLAKGEIIRTSSEDQGWITLTAYGFQMAEFMKNGDRWNKVIGICESINIFCLATVIEILNRCVAREIQVAVDQCYSIAASHN